MQCTFDAKSIFLALILRFCRLGAFKFVRHVAGFPTSFGLYLLDDFVTSIFLIQIWANIEIKKCEVIRSILSFFSLSGAAQHFLHSPR